MQDPTAATHKERTAAIRRTLCWTAAALALAGLASAALEHWGKGHLGTLVRVVAAQGALAPVVFIALDALGVALLVPQVLFTLCAGVLFGAFWGALWASLGLALGALASFLLGRYMLRGRIRRMWGDNPVFQTLDRLSLKHPNKVIAVSRLVPVMPFPVSSYMLAVSHVRPVPYLVLTWLCMLPETALLTCGGHILRAGVVHGRVPWALVAALAGLAALLFLLVRWVRRGMADDDAEAPG